MDRSENLRSVLRALLNERAEYAEWQIPNSLPEQQTIMRSLLNVRPPHPVDDDFLKAQDAELQRQLTDKGVVILSDIAPCGKDGRLRLWQGDITRLQVDAIVDAAFAHGIAHALLVMVGLCRINHTIAYTECIRYTTLALGGRYLIDAIAHLGHLDAVVQFYCIHIHHCY